MNPNFAADEIDPQSVSEKKHISIWVREASLLLMCGSRGLLFRVYPVSLSKLLLKHRQNIYLMQTAPFDNSPLVRAAISINRHHKVLNLALPSNPWNSITATLCLTERRVSSLFNTP